MKNILLGMILVLLTSCYYSDFDPNSDRHLDGDCGSDVVEAYEVTWLRDCNKFEYYDDQATEKTIENVKRDLLESPWLYFEGIDLDEVKYCENWLERSFIDTYPKISCEYYDCSIGDVVLLERSKFDILLKIIKLIRSGKEDHEKSKKDIEE